MSSFAPFAFTLRQLQYIVAIAELASFRRAAEQCHVAQPSLSSQVAQLESVLGVKLFERDRRRVLLTAAGRGLVERAREILVGAGDLREAVKRFADPLAGTIRIGIIPTVSPYLLPVIAPGIRSRFRKLRVLWTEDKTAQLLSSLDGGSLDAALLAVEAGVGNLERDVIARDHFVLATATEHRLSKQTAPATRACLRNQEILLLEDGHCFRNQALAFCGSAGARELEFRATSLSTLVQMVAGGAGITLLPALCVSTEMQRANLRIRQFAKPVPQRTLALVWRRQSPVSTALRLVAAAIRDDYPRTT